MEVKKITEGMTAPQVAQVIDDNFKAQNKILEDDIKKQNNAIGVSEYQAFSEAESVAVGAVRLYNGVLYECVEATIGSFDAKKWKATSFKKETEAKLSELGSEVVDVESRKQDTITISNLLNPNDDGYIEGSYIGSNGQLDTAESYAVSNYIPLTRSNQKAILARKGKKENKGGGFIAYYDSDRNFISAVTMSNSAVATWFEGVSYVRFSISRYKEGENQIVYGDSIIDYIPFGIKNLKENTKVTEGNIVDFSISDSKLNYNSVTPFKTNFFKQNLFNPDDEDYLPNSFYRNESGTIGESEWYAISGYIPFNRGKLILSVNGKQETTTNGGWNLYYNKDKEIIGGDYNINTQQIATWFEGVAFVRFSIHNPQKGNIQIEYGNEVTSYIPYSEYPVIKEEYLPQTNLYKKQTISLLGSDGKKTNAGSLSNGEILSLSNNYPNSIKGNQIGFSAKITDFTGGIQVGRGFTAYNSGYFKITETSVTLIRYEGSEYVKKTVEHGLNITNYIKVVISERLDKALLVIQTLGGVFSQEFEYASAYNGQIAAKSLGASLGDVELCASNGSFKHQVWMFGDSYYGADYKNRQLYWLKNWGMLNCLIQSYAGQASTAAYQDLERCMVYGTPKYLVWSLGMNDDNGSDLADITTGNWYKHFIQVKQLCELNGITLICCTIPEVRGVNYKNKDKMSEVVRNSGLRFIDVAKAVGSNSEGQWYGEGTAYDYQSTDNVHPSEYGASAIATQFLIDFPELMQY